MSFPFAAVESIDEPRRQERDTARPTFHMHPVKDAAASALEGRTVHKAVEYVQIEIQDDTTSIVNRPVLDEHRRRWPRQYARFKAMQQAKMSGTMLTAWGRLPENRIADFASVGLYLVEQLAGLTDEQCARLGKSTSRERDEAAAFLEAAKSTAPLSRLQAQLVERDIQVASLEQQLSDVRRRLRELEADAPRKGAV